MSELTTKPLIKEDLMYHLLRDGDIVEFNSKRKQGLSCDLVSADFRSVDLRGIDAAGIDFSHAYFRQADLRGIDLSNCLLDGASIHDAKISGCLFPRHLSAQEIELSLVYGTRIRYSEEFMNA